jgi:hypothetical protein
MVKVTGVCQTITQTITSNVPIETLDAFKNYVLESRDIDISNIIQTYMLKAQLQTKKRGRKTVKPISPLPQDVNTPSSNEFHKYIKTIIQKIKSIDKQGDAFVIEACNCLITI